MSDAPVVTLAYETRRPRRARMVIAIVATLVLAYALYRWLIPLCYGAQSLYWQTRAESFSLPAGTVVYDEGVPGDHALAKPTWRDDRSGALAWATNVANTTNVVLFCHALTDRGGPAAPTRSIRISFRVLATGSLTRPARIVFLSSCYFDANRHHLRLEAGQIDPLDPSHVTIPVHWGDDQTGSVGVFLINDTLDLRMSHVPDDRTRP